MLSMVETIKLYWYLASCRHLEGKYQAKVGATVSSTITSGRLELTLCLILLTLPPKKKIVSVEGETIPDLLPFFPYRISSYPVLCHFTHWKSKQCIRIYLEEQILH